MHASGPGAFPWRLAGDDGGQGALFDEERVVDRRRGVGEYRELEFVHVDARRIINEVENSPFDFRFTINPYRGCSHGCSYCAHGETPVLLGDGRTKPLGDVRPGDVVCGSITRNAYRQYVTTEVLDHWQTVKPAYRVVLEDDTELIVSGDHRFLTDRGWKYVIACSQGCARRSHLSTTDRLLGPGRRGSPPGQGGEHGTVASRVVTVESLGVELPMYDITSGTGDYISNGVISHNCFARPTHAYLGFGIGDDFDRKIVVKVNAVERLRAELRSPRWNGDGIAMGTNTDPYQRAEGRYRLTRGIIGELTAAKNPFSILTKSTLIVRDLDVLSEAASRTEVRCAFSIGTLDDTVWKMTEPGTPHPRRRIEALARLVEAGITTGVLVAPVIPGLSDAPDQLDEVVRACAEAGAAWVTAIPLHLRPGVRDHFLGELARRQAGPAGTLARRYRGAYLSKADQEATTSTVRVALGRTRWRSGRPGVPQGRRASAGTDAEGNGGEGRGPSHPATAEPGAAEQLSLGW